MIELAEILTGITSWFTGDGDCVSTMPGGIHQAEGDQEIPDPYTVFSFPGWTPEKTFSDNFEDILLRFEVVDRDPGVANIAAAVEALTARFDDAAISIANYYVVELTRVDGGGPAMLNKERFMWVVYKLFLKHTPA